jgi:hypothetical protein
MYYTSCPGLSYLVEFRSLKVTLVDHTNRYISHYNRRVARAFQYGFDGPQPTSCYIPQYGQSSCEGIFDLPGRNGVARAR